MLTRRREKQSKKVTSINRNYSVGGAESKKLLDICHSRSPSNCWFEGEIHGLGGRIYSRNLVSFSYNRSCEQCDLGMGAGLWRLVV